MILSLVISLVKRFTSFEVQYLDNFIEHPECQAFFQSSVLGPPTPSPARECCSSPPLGPMGETHSLEGGGGGVLNSDEGTGTVFYCIIPLRWLHIRQWRNSISYSGYHWFNYLSLATTSSDWSIRI